MVSMPCSTVSAEKRLGVEINGLDSSNSRNKRLQVSKVGLLLVGLGGGVVAMLCVNEVIIRSVTAK